MLCHASLSDLTDYYIEAKQFETEKRAWQEWLAFAPWQIFSGEIKSFTDFYKKEQKTSEDVEQETAADLERLRAWAKGG